MAREKPTCSVVVASHNAQVSIEACLAALESQRPGEEVELIVVDNSTDGTTEIIRERFPNVKLIVQPPSALIPHLWATGIRQSAAEIVAITTAHCIPDTHWLTRLLQAHAAPVSAIGGAIEHAAPTGVVDWAIYFCRYSQYMLPFPEGFAPEIPGDNAAYKRAYLDQCQHVWRHGFWEPAVHAALKKAGCRLLLLPSIVVYHQQSFGFWGFMHQRFQHGRQFGGERTLRLSGLQRGLYIAFSPVIPCVLLYRIVRQVLTKRRHRTRLLVCPPLLMLFLLAWALGELRGYLRGPTR
jgi:glycosyltransferase involved in cell wall biosynthesis